MAKFFVSYSRSAKEEVGKVVALLSASGHEVWWDADIPVMADWWSTILDHVEWCEIFIFVVSEKSTQSAYCLAELKYANDRQRPILPFILDDITYTLPLDLPHRNQWLLYNGDPAQMLSQINNAYKNIEWNLHKDIDAPRPSEPTKGGKSLAQQFQEARRLANEQRFEESKQLFRDIKRVDFDEWGTDCDEWLARLTNYAQIVDLVKDSSTLERAQQAWKKHIRLYGDEFDPYPIKSIFITRYARRFRLIIPISIVFIILIILALSQIIGISRENASTLIPTYTSTSSTAVAQIIVTSSLPTEIPFPTVPPSTTRQPTLTPFNPIVPSSTATVSMTPNSELTIQMVALAETATQERLLLQQASTLNAQQTLIPLSWTPIPTTSHASTFTLTPTSLDTPTQTPRPTMQPTDTQLPTLTIDWQGVTNTHATETAIIEDNRNLLSATAARATSIQATQIAIDALRVQQTSVAGTTATWQSAATQIFELQQAVTATAQTNMTAAAARATLVQATQFAINTLRDQQTAITGATQTAQRVAEQIATQAGVLRQEATNNAEWTAQYNAIATSQAIIQTTQTALARPTSTQVNIPQPTSTRTPVSTSISNQPVAIVTVASANLRSGPGTNYSVIASVSRDEQLQILASTADRTWYLVVDPDHGNVWISASVVTLNVSNNSIQIVATIPPTPQIVPATQPQISQSTGIWPDGTFVRLGCSNCLSAQMYIYSACGGGQTIRIIDYHPGDQIYATVQSHAGCSGVDGKYVLYEVVLQDHGTRGWIESDFVLGP